jgi:hypothetical protein
MCVLAIFYQKDEIIAICPYNTKTSQFLYYNTLFQKVIYLGVTS